MKRRLMALFLALTMLVSMAPGVFAADTGFSDVASDAWCAEAVKWAVDNNITGGIGDGKFGPDQTCTRGQVVTFLWAAAGKPVMEKADNPFTDVGTSDWYYNAVMWAVSNNITGGTSATTFSPEAPCTRAQVVTFLYAAEGKPAVENAKNDFVDVAANDWFFAPVMWAVANDITGGIGNGCFGPDNPCTRGQIALFLYKASLIGGSDEPEVTPEPTPTPEATLPLPNVKELWKQELLCAYELGMPMGKIMQETVSYREMMELLDWFVSYAAPENMNAWKSMLPALRGKDSQITRFDAMTALYMAAQQVGGIYKEHNYWVQSLIWGINHTWNEHCGTWSLFANYAVGPYDCGGVGQGNLFNAAYYYNLARPSHFSGEFPFALDGATNSFVFEDPPTYAEAVLAVVRLISSADPNLFIAEPTAAEREFLNMADAERARIDNAVTDVTSDLSGTVYYVSNKGSDDNDGLSPETPWATLQHAFARQLQPGDGVLLERGGVWWIENDEEWGLTSTAFWIPRGVTLGAYGNGEKPLLRGDLQAANGTDYWDLYSEENGAKIWKSAEQAAYCPVIVFNDGERYASPVLPGMNENARYQSKDGSAFDVSVGLERDLQFCCLMDLTQVGVNGDISNDPNIKGTLYLRCDKGNPAEVFESVHVPQATVGLALGTDTAVDGIALRYFSCNGAVMDGYNGEHSQTVNNCEVGWCGGLPSSYQRNHLGIYLPFAGGGALQCSTAGVRVTDSHIHHCGGFGLIVGIHNNNAIPENTILHYENIFVANNLMEYCGSGVHMADYSAMDVSGTQGYISNFVFENNLVMHTGMGWVQDAQWQFDGGSSPFLSAFETMHGAVDNNGIFLRNNVFYKGSYALFSLSDYHWDRTTPVNALPVFEGNTYVQSANKPILQKNWTAKVYYPSDTTVRDVLGDRTGNLVVLNP